MRIWRIAAIGAALSLRHLRLVGIYPVPGNDLFLFFQLCHFCDCLLCDRHPTQYAHFFLGLAWFLGFWVKYLLHQATGATYYEPHGSFDGSPGPGLSSFWWSASAAPAISSVDFLAFPVVNPVRDHCSSEYCCSILVGIVPQRNLVVCRIARRLRARDQSGIRTSGPGAAARVVLPWPLGGLFAWITDIGLALLLSLLLATSVLHHRRSISFGRRGFWYLAHADW